MYTVYFYPANPEGLINNFSLLLLTMPVNIYSIFIYSIAFLKNNYFFEITVITNLLFKMLMCIIITTTTNNSLIIMMIAFAFYYTVI